MARVRFLAEAPPPPRGYVEDQLRELRDYITRLKDELEFLLTHLGTDNLEQGLTNKILDAADSVDQVDNAEKALEGRVDHVETALDGKQDTLTFDATPTADSANPVTSGGVFTALDGKQDVLTFDTAPTASSTNPVTSEGVLTALEEKPDRYYFALDPGRTLKIKTSAGNYNGPASMLLVPGSNVAALNGPPIMIKFFGGLASRMTSTPFYGSIPSSLNFTTADGVMTISNTAVSGRCSIYLLIIGDTDQVLSFEVTT